MTHDDDHAGADGDEEPTSKKPKSGKKERVLHTRVPAVLEEELKRLATNLRVPVSNVVRAILEDAVDAVDTAAGRAENELLGFADRLARQRDGLRERVERGPGKKKQRKKRKRKPAQESGADCPDNAADVLEGAFGFQPLVLATEVACSVCGRSLPAGSEANRALFDEPGKRVFLGPECSLLP